MCQCVVLTLIHVHRPKSASPPPQSPRYNDRQQPQPNSESHQIVNMACFLVSLTVSWLPQWVHLQKAYTKITVTTIPVYAIHLSTRCRLSISFNTELESVVVLRTSNAFLCALCKHKQWVNISLKNRNRYQVLPQHTIATSSTKNFIYWHALVLHSYYMKL